MSTLNDCEIAQGKDPEDTQMCMLQAGAATLHSQVHRMLDSRAHKWIERVRNSHHHSNGGHQRSQEKMANRTAHHAPVFPGGSNCK